MSTENKERMGLAMTWILRSLSALGAVFLMKIYNSIEENNKTLLELKQSAATNDVFYRMTILEHEGKLKRWEEWFMKDRAE